jgi:hypothetical protein
VGEHKCYNNFGDIVSYEVDPILTMVQYFSLYIFLANDFEDIQIRLWDKTFYFYSEGIWGLV